LQGRLADLSFLPAADIDGRAGPETTFAVTAFQKWAGLTRDGVAGSATMRALGAATRPLPIMIGSAQRIEVLLDRQLALLEQGGRVVLTVPVSTGKGENATPPGSFQVFRKEVKSWSYPFQEWLPWASYFYGGIAFHEYRTSRPRPPRTAACASPATGRSCSTASRRSARRSACSPARSELFSRSKVAPCVVS
jgi:hypothetical protein